MDCARRVQSGQHAVVRSGKGRVHPFVADFLLDDALLNTVAASEDIREAMRVVLRLQLGLLLRLLVQMYRVQAIFVHMCRLLLV